MRMHKCESYIFLSKYSSKSFTLVELIIVIIIVGILAALGISQYSTTVEKSRIAEAKVRLGTMRQLAYQYYLDKGSFDNIDITDVGADNTCRSTDFFAYRFWNTSSASLDLLARRCTASGKTPNATREYFFYLRFNPSTGESSWRCEWTDDWSACFGFPR